MLNAQSRGVPVENIDRSVSPCTDFDAYANGHWRATHPMPAIQNTWALRTVTQDDTRARLRSIAEEDATKAASAPKGSPTQLTGDFYAACMDEPRVNALGLKPLERMLQGIEAVHDVKSLSAQIVRMQEINLAVPLSLNAAQNLHDTTQMIAEIEIHGLGMPDRDYYLRDEPRFKDTREKYTAYMHKMFALAGSGASSSTDADAAPAIAAVMKIETALAQARLSRVELRDPKVTDHLMTFAELKALAPNFDWSEEFHVSGYLRTVTSMCRSQSWCKLSTTCSLRPRSTTGVLISAGNCSTAKPPNCPLHLKTSASLSTERRSPASRKCARAGSAA